MRANEFCKNAADLMENRAKERDTGEERSMCRCVETFNAMTGHDLSVEEGWLFMVYLKHSRMRAGAFQRDDYEDAVSYEALMAEEAEESATPDNAAPRMTATEVRRTAPAYPDNTLFLNEDYTL